MRKIFLLFTYSINSYQTYGFSISYVKFIWLFIIFRSYINAKSIIIAGIILATVILTIIAICSVYGASRDVEIQENEDVPPDPEILLPPSWSKLKIFKRGAVCADAALCASIGKYVKLLYIAIIWGIKSKSGLDHIFSECELLTVFYSNKQY